MKQTALVKVDSKGRITIPLTMREAIGIEPGMLMAIIADIDKKEIIVTPIFTNKGEIYEIEVVLVDRPGAMAKVTDALARENVDIIASRCTTVMRGVEGSCIMIVDLSRSSVDVEKLKNILSQIDVVTQVKVKKFETTAAAI
ncbi:MAG: ACT domain-containing protein [Desulfurococcales archaeon]|nr:ACT domain-containing protein [Desulfurococcales archaeon]